MENINPWPLMRAGKAEREKGLRLVQQAYVREPDGSHIMEFGVALLWLGRYASAWEHFRSAAETYARSGDAFYGMAGVAKWCLGEPGEAVAQWRAGLEAKYARAAGLGVRMPLLLFFASVLKPELADKRSAEALLREKVRDLRVKSWPGPIARLIVDQISEKEFQEHCRGNSEEDSRDREWLAEFYRNLMALETGSLSVFKKSMRELTDTSQPEWQAEEVFLRRIWGEEFFLARHEAI